MRTPMMNLSNDINISNSDWYALTNQIGRMNSEQVVSMSSINTTHCVDIPSSESVAFTNYDVLFAAHPSTSSIGNQFQAPPYTLIDHSHIGNRRFIVLLSIYRPRYCDAAKKGDEAKCKRIALEIIKTVRQQCSGRFFRQDDVNGPWHQIEEDDASLVTAVQCTMKVKSMKLKTSSDIDVVEQPSKKARCATTTTSSLDLLCNAAMKKVSAPNEKISFVSKPKPFDVICSSNQTTLKENANHVGNNRLQVILDMRTKTYDASTQEKRSEIIKEVVKSIIDDSSSQFLSEVEGASSEEYLPLSREKAAICIKNALNTKFLVDLEPKICGSEAIKLVRRRNKKRALDKIERRNIDKGFMNGDVVRIPISVPKRITHVPKAA